MNVPAGIVACIVFKQNTVIRTMRENANKKGADSAPLRIQ